MLVNLLYNIISTEITEKNTIDAQVRLNDEDPIFAGHFPGQPVLPGVCLTNIMTDVVSGTFQKSYFLSTADYIKFLNPVIPYKGLLLLIRINSVIEDPNTGIIGIEGAIFHETSPVLKLKGKLQPLK